MEVRIGISSSPLILWAMSTDWWTTAELLEWSHWEFKTTRINLVGALREKVDDVQERTNDVSRDRITKLKFESEILYQKWMSSMGSPVFKFPVWSFQPFCRGSDVFSLHGVFFFLIFHHVTLLKARNDVVCISSWDKEAFSADLAGSSAVFTVCCSCQGRTVSLAYLVFSLHVVVVGGQATVL